MLPHCIVFTILSLCWRTETLKKVQDESRFRAVSNANHIFNTIHSSLRQWGSSLNHNGMSIFPAIVPQGTVLYHGTSTQDAITGLEWVAFERDHAMQFAHLYVAPLPGLPLPNKNYAVKFRPDKESPTIHEDKHYKLFDQRKPIDSDLPWIFPGYLHSYSTKRNLHLLYLDGSAAAKTSQGTLDLSDLLLLNDSRMTVSADHDRARRLCTIANEDWAGRIDGFIRMEAGFEIIICSFADSLHLVDVVRMEGIEDGGTIGGKEDVFHWLRAAAARYDGIGGSPPRVQLNYNTFLTAYAYPLDLFRNASASLPRLLAAPQNILEDMRCDIKAMISQPGIFDEITQRLYDWQAAADMIVQKYANPLQYLVTSPELGNSSTRLAQELNYLLRPFLDTSHRDAETETKRCAAEFMPPYFNLSANGLSGQAIYTVSYQVCSTLIDVLWSLCNSPTSAALTACDEYLPIQQHASLLDLTAYLAWTEWKKCRGCLWDEICSIPMFPFGVTEDHETPRCRGVNSLGRLWEYWDEA